MKSVFCLLQLGCAAAALAAETLVPMSAQTGMNVTIYNEDRALIKDERKVDLTQGVNVLAFQGVSANMMPQTALLKGQGLTTREQNFNFDLLSKDALLDKSVGQKVLVEYIDPATGKASRESAELVAYNDRKPVLKINDKIETDYPGRIIFSSVPANLRAQPTLSITTMSDKAGPETVELDYLTTGLSWKADYVAKLNADETKMSLNGFVTLSNRSGTDYKQALLQLVAGDVNMVPEYVERRARAPKAMMAFADTMSAGMEAEALTDFYIYTLPYKTDVLSNQTKQVALLSAADIAVAKTYELRLPVHLLDSSEERGMKPNIFVTFVNSQENKLGKPLPKGVTRLYKEDAKGNMQFVGEDRIQHTADKETVRLAIGSAFNLTVDMKRLAVRRVSDSVRMGTYEVTLKNGGDAPAQVQLTQEVPDRFKIMEENQKSERVNSNTVKWVVPVPAKGETKLTYKIQFQY
ncbi:MAG: DUF4139 domain-containing protein [Alphaproteobacteria bacterium]|nr:DUF4139 domain-containing protein [Alphaproteobacteria bacterium]